MENLRGSSTNLRGSSTMFVISAASALNIGAVVRTPAVQRGNRPLLMSSVDEAERAVEVQQHFRDEVEAINERRVFLERIGLQPASPRSLALRERAARLAEPPSAAAPGDSSMIEDATKDVVASERVQSAELRRRLKYG